MGDFRMEGAQFKALDRAYDALENEIKSSNEIEKYLETAYKMAGILGQNQKKTENEIAKQAEEYARKENKRQVATYRGSDVYVLSALETGLNGMAGYASFSNINEGKKWKSLGLAASSIKGVDQNRLEAQRAESGSNKNSLDEQAQRMRGSASQNGQSAQEKIQMADQIAQSKLRAMQTVASA